MAKAQIGRFLELIHNFHMRQLSKSTKSVLDKPEKLR